MSATTTTAKIKLALEGANAVEQGLARVQGKVSDAGKAMMGLAGGISAAGFAAWVKGAIDAADETGKMAQKTGLLTKEVAGLQLAFDQGGAGDKLQSTLARLSKEAASGNEAFKSMGIAVAGADGKLKSTRELLGEVADKFASYGVSTEKTALAQELFGKSGADLIPVLNGGSAALDEYDAKARALGLTLDDETTAAAERFNDQIDLLSQRGQGLARQLASELLPVLTTISDAFATGAQSGGSMSTAGAALSTVIETVTVLGANAAYVFRQIGNEIGGMAAQAVALATLDFSGFKNIGAMMRADAAAARAEIDAFSNRVLNARKVAESLKGASGLDEPRFKRMLAAGGEAAREAAPRVKSLTDSLGRQRTAAKTLTEAERELAEVRKNDLAVGALRNKMAEEAYKARIAEAEVEAKFRQIVIDKELDWADEEEKLRREAEEDQIRASQNAADRAATAWDYTAASIADSLSGAIMAGFEDGKGFASGFGDYLKKLFKTSIANELSNALRGAFNQALGGSANVGGSLQNSLLGSVMQYFTGGSAGASAASLAYANAIGAAGGDSMGALIAANGGWSGVSTGAAAGGASAGGAASTSSMFSSLGYTGWAALIAAAVVVANGLYEKGWNRDALGDGKAQTVRFGQYSRYTSDPNMGRSAIYDYADPGMSKARRGVMDAVGISSKWADILSGTTRMAHLFGRRLKEVGLQANIAGGDVSVSGYAYEKGGIFRGNKTRAIDVDQRDAAAFQAQVNAMIEGTRSMARALGYGTEAIDNYTGSIRVNFKGAKDAAEIAERVQTAMDDMQYAMINAASGAKMSREEFTRLMDGVRQDISAAGISTEGMTDILASGIVDGASAAQIGEQLSSMILGGIYNTLAQNAFGPVAAAISAQLVTPIFTAIAAGVPVSQAVSAAAINNIVAMANAAADAMNVIFNDPEFRAAMDRFGEGIAGVAGAAAGVKVPAFRAPAARAVDTSAADAARERAQLEMEELRLKGDTVEIRRRELLEIKPGNRALQERVWALQDEKDILDERRDLERRLLEMQGDTLALRALERNELHEVNRILFDQIAALEDTQKLKDTWSDLIDTMSDEMRRLREQILGTTPEGRAYAIAEFSTALAAARAGDSEAAARLGDLGRAVVDIAEETAASLGDLRSIQSWVYAGLNSVRDVGSSISGVAVPKFDVGTNMVPRDMLAMVHQGEAIVPKAYNPAMGGFSDGAVVQELRAIRGEMAVMREAAKANERAVASMAQTLDRVTVGGTALRTKEAA